MITFIKSKQLDDSDIVLDVVKVGMEYCIPSKQIVNCVRPCYSLHFVMFGKGTLISSDGKTYDISKGDAFLLYEGEQYKYYPKSSDPWAYIWVEFTGKNLDKLMSACGFEKNCVSKHVKDFSTFVNYMRHAYDVYDASDVQTLRCNAYFMLIVGKFMQQELDAKIPPQMALKKKQLREVLIYINNNLAAKLTNSIIADTVGVSLRLLNTLFNEVLGMTPVDYINNYRISTACECFQIYNASVKDAASIVGFADEKYFSRVFSEIKGMSPQEYKKRRPTEDPFLWIKEKGMLFR